MPRFKPKRKARLACRFTTGTIRVDTDGRHVTLPRLGTIRTHEPTGKLLTRVQAGTARILSSHGPARAGPLVRVLPGRGPA
ncbi:hypothetical protein ABT124_48165 [Streptomyces sp. NPDC001982]|uniref:hypothetical protein n=1 Tax=Streptomyces sp. NPDC001982 TaxID=3154405 RepID=UPI00332195BA